MDTPKSLQSAEEREARLSELDLPHVSPLSAFVRELRAEQGLNYSIPYFDPRDGGIHAEVLFLLEAPGPKAVLTGFISRNNPDETAKNFFLLNQEVGLDRRRTASWNIVPWYIGSGRKIRSASSQDIELGRRSLKRVLKLLNALRVVVLVGAKAARARSDVINAAPDVHIISMPHPSPMFVNRSPRNRERIRSALRQVMSALE